MFRYIVIFYRRKGEVFLAISEGIG